MNAKDRDEGYRDLCHAIVIQAVKDYVWSRDYIKEHKQEYQQLIRDIDGVNWNDISEKIKRKKFTYEQAKYMIPECESFFRGWWFQNLVDYNGEEFIRRLRRTSWRTLRTRLRYAKEEESV